MFSQAPGARCRGGSLRGIILILINAVAPVAEIGGKAYHLLSMGIKNTPAPCRYAP